MPLYMDLHVVPGATPRDVAEAHHLDMMHQEQHDCKCLTYWLDEARSTVFCLIEAPEKEAVVRMHQNAHGLLPSKIIEVSTSVVESFLGRLYDPANAVTTEDGLKVFTDSSFRILMFTNITDRVLLKHKLGHDKATEFLRTFNRIVKQQLLNYGGKEAEYEGDSFVASFCSAAPAVACAMNIRKEIALLPGADAAEFVVSVNSGEPIEKGEQFFGDTLLMASYMCMIAPNNQITIGSKVKELVVKEHFKGDSSNVVALTPQDEAVLQLLFTKLEENWQDAEFDIAEYCQQTIMSKSQLYRKTVASTGLSPNVLLKNFRLEKAKELMKKQRYNISQITFDCGFTSPSYFTKCFKKKFGLLPMEYVDLLH